MPRTAIILFNLGGPDSPDSVRPFLYNLFADKAIIRLPGPFRQALAWLIASRRAKVASEIYAKIGGKSPILEQTQAQAAALDAVLGADWKCFVAMRYWHPFIAEAFAEMAAWRPDRIVLLPLYPHFSTTTTASALTEWRRCAASSRFGAPTATICCYPLEKGLIEAQAKAIEAGLDKVTGKTRVLFSAHGLPERIVAAGDPYPLLVEKNARAIVAKLDRKELDWQISYQSRVGRLAWIGPGTDAEIERAGSEGVALVVSPIAFVSEHSETLVELDIDYAKLARAAGVPHYVRAPTPGTDPTFIAGLARLVQAAAERATGLESGSGGRLCPVECGACPNQGGI
jgi:ferrochelatase